MHRQQEILLLIQLDHIIRDRKRLVDNLAITNNGDDFREEDWDRLSTIASGNPDPHKVGMFGVGFYSVFALTDQPTVISGSQGMRFIWQGQMLTFGKSVLTCSQASKRKTITQMPLKTTRQMDFDGAEWELYLKDLKAFLLRLIVFLKNVNHLSIEVDGHVIFEVSKALLPLQPVSIPQGEGTSQGGLFVSSVAAATYSNLVITASSHSSSGHIKVQKATYQLLESTLAIQVFLSCLKEVSIKG